MRWKGRRQSENVDDRRRLTPRGKMAMGGGLGAIVLAVVVVLLGGDPGAILGGGGGPLGAGSGGGAGSQGPPIELTAAEKELGEFAGVVLADTEDVWTEQFRRMGKTYKKPTMVLYKDRVQTAGGMADAAMGPFYMSADENIYIDLSFYKQLKERFGAPGDFAQAYVIAHEVGHHVQHLMGTLDKVHGARSRLSEKEYNKLSVRCELQADFYAGVWAHHADRNWRILEPGDVEEALTAASAIGDDNIQRQSQGHVMPDSFTHGSSAQRVAWFRHGLETGDVRQGDTFDNDLFRRVDPGK